MFVNALFKNKHKFDDLKNYAPIPSIKNYLIFIYLGWCTPTVSGGDWVEILPIGHHNPVVQIV